MAEELELGEAGLLGELGGEAGMMGLEHCGYRQNPSSGYAQRENSGEKRGISQSFK